MGERIYHKVIVPLDGSRLAEVALPYAEEVVARMGVEMILLSVLESDETRVYQKYYTYAQKVAGVTRLHTGKYLDTSKSQHIEVGTATRIGNPAEGILDYANRYGSCLVVMATHGRSGLSRWAVGSVADKVARASSGQPVMLIRARDGGPEVNAKRIFKKALVPLDGSETSRAVLPYVTEMASRLEMELTLFQAVPENHHHSEDAAAYLSDECAKLKAEGITAEYQVRVGSPAEEIINLGQALAFDLVAMSTHGKTGFTLWSLGSVAQKVLLGGTTPLLLVKQ